VSYRVEAVPGSLYCIWGEMQRLVLRVGTPPLTSLGIVNQIVREALYLEVEHRNKAEFVSELPTGDIEMTRPEQDDPSNLGDMLTGATIIVCCVAVAAVVILALVIDLIVWLLVG
jgi:hypothetical protein